MTGIYFYLRVDKKERVKILPPLLRHYHKSSLELESTHLDVRQSVVMTWIYRALTLLMLLGSSRLHAADWPQFRGPNHDSTTPERILRAWPKDGPRPLWKVPLTDGFSSITVSGGRAFTLV